MFENKNWLLAISVGCALLACELNSRRLSRVELFLIERERQRRRPWWKRLYSFLTPWRG